MKTFIRPPNHPTVHAILATLGIKTGKAVKVSLVDRVSIDTSFSGSRCTAAALDALSLTTINWWSRLVNVRNATPYGPSGGIRADLPIDPTMIVVEHRKFQGKDLGYAILVNPAAPHRAGLICPHGHTDCATSPALATACAESTAPAITDRDRDILATIRGYKGGDYRRQALARLGATEADYARLVKAGLVKRNKVGALSLTPDGKNESLAGRMAS